ncbi:hypothetical protein ACQKPT_17165 [Pseudomonas monteilii]|uniref:hypothetical protein n=1 Tax=Pseudomonas monteilii TaxID=76759 RepID=UPI003D02FAF3
MFETHIKAVTPSPFDYDKGLLGLDFVSQRFHAEWFYVDQHIRTTDGTLSNRMLLIDDIAEFKGLLSARTKSAWIQDIYLVTPGAINNLGTWAINLLLEVKEVVLCPKQKHKALVYKVENAAGYYRSELICNKWEHLPSKVIYKRNPPL